MGDAPGPFHDALFGALPPSHGGDIGPARHHVGVSGRMVTSLVTARQVRRRIVLGVEAPDALPLPCGAPASSAPPSVVPLGAFEDYWGDGRRVPLARGLYGLRGLEGSGCPHARVTAYHHAPSRTRHQEPHPSRKQPRHAHDQPGGSHAAQGAAGKSVPVSFVPNASAQRTSPGMSTGIPHCNTYGCIPMVLVYGWSHSLHGYACSMRSGGVTGRVEGGV